MKNASCFIIIVIYSTVFIFQSLSSENATQDISYGLYYGMMKIYQIMVIKMLSYKRLKLEFRRELLRTRVSEN